jgi:hypothetical protein
MVRPVYRQHRFAGDNALPGSRDHLEPGHVGDDDVDLRSKADGADPLPEGNRVSFVNELHNPSNQSRRDENDRNLESVLFEDDRHSLVLKDTPRLAKRVEGAAVPLFQDHPAGNRSPIHVNVENIERDPDHRGVSRPERGLHELSKRVLPT